MSVDDAKTMAVQELRRLLTHPAMIVPRSGGRRVERLRAQALVAIADGNLAVMRAVTVRVYRLIVMRRTWVAFQMGEYRLVRRTLAAAVAILWTSRPWKRRAT